MLSMSKQPISASLIVSCMDRQDNLLITLKSWLNAPYIGQIVIIDYSSAIPLSTNTEIKHMLHSDHRIRLVRVEGETKYNLGKSYNLAADFTDQDIIIKIDSDYECVEYAWLDSILKSADINTLFVHADYKFTMELSGFFIISKSHFLYFREDLNGYGYDELDLYERTIRRYPHLKETIWYDIHQSVRHIPHDDKDRTINYKSDNHLVMEKANRELCQTYSPVNPDRNIYNITDQQVTYFKKSIDRIFCINLLDRKDRWSRVSVDPRIDRFDAISHRDALSYNLKLNPVDLSSLLYFQVNYGALGCYLSHYLLWNKIITERIPLALIIEDDVCIKSVDLVLKSNVVLDKVELVQLSKRLKPLGNRIIFDGGDGYILSYSGACKLVDCTNNPSLLAQVIPDKFPSIVSLADKGLVDDMVKWHTEPSITCAVDKFIGYCCDEVLTDSIRLDYIIYPMIDLDPKTNVISDINLKSNNSWQLTEAEALRLLLLNE